MICTQEHLRREWGGGRLARLAIVTAALAMLSTSAGGGENRRELDAVRSLMREQSAQLEREIAQLIMNRLSVAGEEKDKLEMRIDLRIICRWVINGATAQAPLSDAYAAAWVRAQLCTMALGALESTIHAQKEKLTPRQFKGLGDLHQLTFALQQMDRAGGMDEVCRSLGSVLLALAGPPQLTEDKLQPVRPRPPSGGVSAPPGNAPSLAELAEEVRRLNVSVPLRQQLTALVIAASQPAGTDRDLDAQRATRMLIEVVDLARGLTANVGVSPDARVTMEGQLAEGLALFMDSRTRAAGAARIAVFSDYRQMLLRIAALKLSPVQARQFAAMFVWAREHPQRRERVLSAVERFQACNERFNNRLGLPTTQPSARRAWDDLEQQFDEASRAFVLAALAVPRSGPTSRPIDDLESHANEMLRIVGLLEEVQRLPATIDLLCSYKPRNTSALEKRLWAAAVLASRPGDSLTRREASKLIGDVDRLAALARAMPRMSLSEVPLQLDRRWTGGRLMSLDAKWRQTVGEIGTAVAGGAAVDAAKLDELPAAAQLYRSLAQATAMDMALAQGAPALARWVDWRLGLDDVKALLAPYPAAMADAFAGLLAGAPGWQAKWDSARGRFAPIVARVNSASACRTQCAVFPGGIHWLASALSTPMDNAPFATERWLSCAVCSWRALVRAGRDADAQAVFRAIEVRLAE